MKPKVEREGQDGAWVYTVTWGPDDSGREVVSYQVRRTIDGGNMWYDSDGEVPDLERKFVSPPWPDYGGTRRGFQVRPLYANPEEPGPWTKTVYVDDPEPDEGTIEIKNRSTVRLVCRVHPDRGSWVLEPGERGEQPALLVDSIDIAVLRK